MGLILNIDTASETAFVNIADNGVVISEQKNPDQKDHAAFLQPAIQKLIKDTGISLNRLDAVAVSAGPGSYTGLRVGMASAKGLCYALEKPLIAANSLEILTIAVKNSNNEINFNNTLLCPMIDARRMEVFTALYNSNMEVQADPAAVVLNEASFSQWLSAGIVYFFGSGSIKWKDICTNENAQFLTLSNAGAAMALLTHAHFSKCIFSDLKAADPMYIKDFYTGAK